MTSSAIHFKIPSRLIGLVVIFSLQVLVRGFTFSGSPDGCLSTLPAAAVVGSTITLSNQESLDSIINCTSITGADFNISTFPGDFILPNLVDYTGLITSQDTSYPIHNSSTLTSLSLPKLQGTFGGLNLEGISSLKALNLPLVNYSSQIIALIALPNLSTLNISSLTGSNQALGIEGIGIENLSLNLANTSQVQVETGGIGPKTFLLNGKSNITTDLLAIVNQFSYDGVSIGGGFEAAETSELSLPNLKSVGTSFTITNGTFGSGFVGALNLGTVGGYFVLENNTMNATRTLTCNTNPPRRELLFEDVIAAEIFNPKGGGFILALKFSNGAKITRHFQF